MTYQWGTENISFADTIVSASKPSGGDPFHVNITVELGDGPWTDQATAEFAGFLQEALTGGGWTILDNEQRGSGSRPLEEV